MMKITTYVHSEVVQRLRAERTSAVVEFRSIAVDLLQNSVICIDREASLSQRMYMKIDSYSDKQMKLGYTRSTAHVQVGRRSAKNASSWKRLATDCLPADIGREIAVRQSLGMQKICKDLRLWALLHIN